MYAVILLAILEATPAQQPQYAPQQQYTPQPQYAAPYPYYRPYYAPQPYYYPPPVYAPSPYYNPYYSPYYYPNPGLQIGIGGGYRYHHYSPGFGFYIRSSTRRGR